jgi:hypothetical protein
MTLTLLQPVFAPNLYDLAVMLQADRVILDDLETWSRKGRVHRALIRTPEGTNYIHIPVRTGDRNKPIKEVRIDQESDWITPLLRSLKFNYRNSLYFDFYEPEIEADFNEGKGYEYLLPFILYLRKRLFRFLELGLSPKERLASECREYDHDPDRFARSLGAEKLFQEYDSRHYQRQADMRSEPDFSHPEYRQHFEGFLPWCSAYDLLFQYGPESFKVIDQLQ